MPDISFFHIGIKPKATKYVLESVRKYHKDSTYFLVSDGHDFGGNHELAIQYSCAFSRYNTTLGGPKQPFGYDKSRIIEFLDRFRYGCHLSLALTGVEHVMMLEDDVILVNPVTVDKSWQMACHNITTGNEIPDSVLNMIEEFSGKRPITNQYGAGGGSIFNAKTFLENYDRVIKFFEDHSEYIMNNLYPTFGWIDCFMVIYFMLCGKDYQRNPHLIDTNTHHNNFDFDGFVNNLSPEIQIVNNYKKFYYE